MQWTPLVFNLNFSHFCCRFIWSCCSSFSAFLLLYKSLRVSSSSHHCKAPLQGYTYSTTMVEAWSLPSLRTQDFSSQVKESLDSLVLRPKSKAQGICRAVVLKVWLEHTRESLRSSQEVRKILFFYPDVSASLYFLHLLH